MKRLTLIVGLLVVLIVVIGATLWAPDRPVEELKARWAQPPSAFVSVQGMQVHVRDEGPRDAALPVVLLHGTSASLHTWEGWSAALSRGHRVVRFDLPGFGLTGPAPDGDYRIERYAGFVIAMLDELGIEQAVLAGNSLGGQIAWETGLLAPERIAGLVLINAAGYPAEADSMPIGFRLAQTPGIGAVMRNILPRSMIESSLHEVYGDPDLVDDELIDLYYAMALREGNRQALIRRFRQRDISAESAGRIARVTQPALIIWGGRDRLIPPTQAERFVDDIADSELAMFEQFGHVPHEEAPALTVQPVETFLSGL